MRFHKYTEICNAAFHKYTLDAQTKASASCRQLAVSGHSRTQMPATLRSTNTHAQTKASASCRQLAVSGLTRRSGSPTVSSPSFAKRAMRMGTIVSGQKIVSGTSGNRGGRWVVEVYQGLCSALAGGVCADGDACNAALRKYTLHGRRKPLRRAGSLPCPDSRESLRQSATVSSPSQNVRCEWAQSSPDKKGIIAFGTSGIIGVVAGSSRYIKVFVPLLREASVRTQMPATLRSTNTPWMPKRKPLRRAGSLPCPDTHANRSGSPRR